MGIGSVATILTLTRAVSVGAKPASNGFRKEAEGWQEEVTSDNIREAFAKKRSKKGAWLGKGWGAPWPRGWVVGEGLGNARGCRSWHGLHIRGPPSCAERAGHSLEDRS